MSDLQRKELSPAWKATKPFLNGGLSGMAATCIIQPIDMVKVRIQIGAQGGPVSTLPLFRSYITCRPLQLQLLLQGPFCQNCLVCVLSETMPKPFAQTSLDTCRLVTHHPSIS